MTSQPVDPVAAPTTLSSFSSSAACSAPSPRSSAHGDETAGDRKPIGTGYLRDDGRPARNHAVALGGEDRTCMTNIRFDDGGFTAETFLALAQRVWPGEYGVALTASALPRSMNFAAWDADRAGRFGPRAHGRLLLRLRQRDPRRSCLPTPGHSPGADVARPRPSPTRQTFPRRTAGGGRVLRTARIPAGADRIRRRPA